MALIEAASPVFPPFPVIHGMVSKRSTGRAVLALLLICLLGGAGGSELWAGDAAPDFQLVLVLDFVEAPRDAQVSRFITQGAGLLVHLLSERHHLGLVARGKGGPVILPAARLSPDHRARTLKELASLTPAPEQASLKEVMKQALTAFDPKGPQRLVLFFLTDASREAALQHKNSKASHTGAQPEIMALAREAGAVVFAGLLAPAPSEGILQTLTSTTGGRWWQVAAASDLHLACLKLYEHLEQPQQASLGSDRVLLDQWVKEAVLVATRATPGKGVMLTSPSGSRLTPWTRAKTVQWIACQAYDLITISPPRPGAWTLVRDRSGESRVFLRTSLKLTVPGAVPREVGEDEALTVAAVVHGTQELPAGSDLLRDTQIQAELRVGSNPPRTMELIPLASTTPSPWPPGTRVGQFPALHHTGEGTLTLSAQGKAWQRQIALPLTFGRPWYQAAAPAGTSGPAQLRFQASPGRRPEKLWGTVNLKSPHGSLAGAFVNPVPGAEIVLAGPAGAPGPLQAHLHLTGIAPGGRPLAITSAPGRLPESSQAAPVPPLQPETASTPPPGKPGGWLSILELPEKVKRRWHWLSLTIVGLAAFLTAAFLLMRQHFGAAASEEGEADDSSSKKNLLMLKAQVENLTKEKAQLQKALEEAGREVSQLKAAKEELQGELARQAEKSQTKLKSVEDLEKKLAEAEQEAKAVQAEYMALYARSQQEKETLKKG